MIALLVVLAVLILVFGIWGRGIWAAAQTPANVRLFASWPGLQIGPVHVGGSGG